MTSIIDHLENKTILVTGVTGFLGKVFVEKILRVQPNIKKLYVLIRASDPNSALHRFHTEVTPVAGDMALENLGVTNVDLLNEMRTQIDVVVNSAATTKFDERYDVAFAINTLGVKHVSSFVNECSKIKLLLLVSTAYVSGEKSGIILETPFKMGETLNGRNDLNIKEEKKMIHERHTQLAFEKANEEAISTTMKDLGIQRAQIHGWPNTYVFTKAMGEMLVFEGLRQDLPLVVLRPTIVTSTYKEPFPGWTEGVKSIDSFTVAYGRGRTSTFLGDPSKVLDLVPVDMVINAMLIAIVVHFKKPYSRIIYNVGSSKSNPLRISSFVNYLCDYFAKYPLMSRDGNPIRASNKIRMLSSIASFHRHMAIRYIIPLKVFNSLHY
ncbi:hypothetical protein QVD17_00209 [Tagetes erecta]|uniref:Fatty acyl-CoA reductase n=1 Tax=Tagetes erecta TaxID=13708 RepID=A0AAD8L8C8_TARER|nr:hypothetical protein QVD17_00209 [Tagetes erecta]